MNSVEALASELSLVPRVLLDVDEVKVLDDGLHALSAIEAAADVRPRVAVVGPSGAGKSWLVNQLAEGDVSPTGVLRPTTADPVFVPVSRGAASVGLVDTPAWEHSSTLVVTEIDRADAVVVVVTPSRYADKSVADLLGRIGTDAPTVVVMNRMESDGGNRVAEDAERVLGNVVLPVAENGTASGVWDRVLEAIGPRDEAGSAVLAAVAAGSGRFVARTVTARSTELGKLAEAVGEADVPKLASPFSVLDEWRLTADSIIAAVSGLRDAVDHEIGLNAEPGLVERFRLLLSAWDADAFREELDEWRLDTEAAFIASARIRWRPRATEDLIRRVAWKAAVNPAVTLPPRVARVTGDRLSDVVLKRYDALVAVVGGAAESRLSSWEEAISEVSDYAPGPLLGAVEHYEADGADV